MLNLLRKLGILRYGVKTGKYTSAKDMPTEFLMNDVANAEKDLVNKQDIENVRESLKTPKGKSKLKWVVVGLVGFLGICFVLGMLFGTDEDGAEPRQTTVQKDAADSTASARSVAAPQTAPRVLTDTDSINELFDKVRQANLVEDIGAFMSYYATSFPDRPGKEKKTLETWQKYDFASLDFFVFDLKIQDRRAEASVGWEMALLEKGATNPRLIETTNEVVLEKGGSGWQIVSLQ